jgi:hypothetical protein
MTQPPLPQPQLAPTGLTFEQYEAYTQTLRELDSPHLSSGGRKATRADLSA